MEKCKGKVAIVTGARAGIGAAISIKLLEAGVEVVCLARRKDRLEQFSKTVQDKPGEFFPVQCDMTVPTDILKAFKWITEKVDPISILVNNAGIYRQFDLTDFLTDGFKQLFDTSIIVLAIATREAAKNMKENKIEGHIIHISSVAARGVFYAGIGTYCASKHAVLAFTEGLRLDLNAQKSKIKITSVSTGIEDTEILVDVPKETIDIAPMLKAEDIGDAVIYVLSTPPGVQVHVLIIKPTGENF